MKVIDLLNKIANGEEVPEKIKVNRYIYTYAPYIDYINEDNNYLMDIIELNQNDLNDEIEIIEEDKKIEKIDVNHLQQIKKWKRAKILGNKINEIIDYLEEKE